MPRDFYESTGGPTAVVLVPARAWRTMAPWYDVALLAAALGFAHTAVSKEVPASCSDAKQTPGSRNVTITVGGRTRMFDIYVPFHEVREWPQRAQYVFSGGTSTDQTRPEIIKDGYSTLGPPTDPLPLVINWHGCNGHYPLLDYHKVASYSCPSCKRHIVLALRYPFPTRVFPMTIDP